MRRYAPSVFAFLLGVLCVLGIQTSTFVQRLAAEAPPNCPKPPVLPEALRKSGMVLVADSSKPGVPESWYHARGENVTDILQLDGLDCKGCTMRAKLVTYAGGQFKCENCSISSENGMYLEGAALNTLRMLQFVGAVPAPQPNTEPTNPRPQIKMAALGTPKRADWISLAK